MKRMNRTLLNMIRTLPGNFKGDWRSHLHKITFAYDCTKNASTQFSPFTLLFGRLPRLPIDFMFPAEEYSNKISYPEYVDKRKDAMREAYDVARINIKKSLSQQKKQYGRLLSKLLHES